MYYLDLTCKEPFWRNIWAERLAKAAPIRSPPESRYKLDVWREAFAEHPDRKYVEWLLTGLRDGFHIGFTGERPQGRARNLPTNNFEKREIVEWLVKGHDKGYILGPFKPDECPLRDVVISPVGAVPKPPNKCRMIHHLSAAQGPGTKSVNDVIEDEMKRVTYVTTKEIVRLADAVGQGGYLWTVDAQDAYVRVPVHPSEWALLGIKFNGRIFVMTCLPFGLASSCKIYNAFADGVEWVVINSDRKSFYGDASQGFIQLMRHYLDDFVGGHKDKKVASAQFKALVNWFQYLQIPTQPRKCEPPATRQKILGSLYDTETRMISLPQDKASRYQAAITSILRRGRVTKGELQSLGGQLRFAARHVWCGAAFCRRLEWAHASVRRTGHHVRLNRAVREDLRWWSEVLEDIREGISFDYILRPRDSCSWTIWTDACVNPRKAGFGGLSSDGRWFQFEVPMERFKGKKPDINWCELAAVVVALQLWAPEHPQESVLLRCDNAPACGQLYKQSTIKERPDIFALVRTATGSAIRHRYHFWIEHIKGENNDPADALSRYYEDPFEGVDRLQPQLRGRMRPKPDLCEELFEALFLLFIANTSR